MKKMILTLAISLSISMSFATEIVATIIFENLTNIEFTSGEFTIIDLNKKIKVADSESFKITLPKKGKYQFSFISEDFTAYILNPSRINKRKKIIRIRLLRKNEIRNGGVYPFLMNLELNDKQIEQGIAFGTLSFVIHGIDNSIPEEYVKFKEKYGVGLLKENCLMDPLSFKKATKNNQIIFNYLNIKYGPEWLTDLKTKPFGIR